MTVFEIIKRMDYQMQIHNYDGPISMQLPHNTYLKLFMELCTQNPSKIREIPKEFTIALAGGYITITEASSV